MGGMKNEVAAVRSSTCISTAASSIGGPSSISTEVVSMLHTKIGRRDHVMPGARWLNTVTSMLSAFRIMPMPTSAKANRYPSIPASAWSPSVG